MSPSQVLLIYALLFLVCVALFALVLLFAGRGLKIASASYVASLLACVVIGGAFLLIVMLRTLLERWLPGSAVYGAEWVTLAPSIVLVALEVLLTVAAAWVCVKVMLFATWGQAGLAAIITLVGGSLVSWPLAVLVRAKVIERIDVATGYMAPTIYGTHAEVVCENCGTTYAVGAPNPTTAGNSKAPDAYATVCWNCGQANRLPADVQVYPGDSLVLSKSGQPDRWDLAAIKSTGEAPVWCLGRVVGLPGEKVEISGGEVYVRGKRVPREPGVSEDMWVPVCDTLHIPAKPVAEGLGWKTVRSSKSSTWKWDPGDREWISRNERSDPDELLYAGRISERNSYNLRPDGKAADDSASMPVGDIRLDIDVDELSGEGRMGIDWDFNGLGVSVAISPAGDLELAAFDRSDPQNATRLGSARGKLTSTMARSAQLTFAVRDGLAYATENGVLVAKIPVGSQELSAVRRPDPSTAPCRLAISTSLCTLKLTRLMLWRDMYLRGADTRSVTLDADSYYLARDNNMRSKDTRLRGTVKRADIEGIGRWIYWPLARWNKFQ